MLRHRMLVALIVLFVTPSWSFAEDLRLPDGWIGLGYTFHKSSKAGVPPWLHVQQVAPDGPAYLAGIRPQDVISAIDGRPIAFADMKATLAFFAARLTPGRTFKFLIVRRDKKFTVRVTVAPLPEEYQRRWNDNKELMKRSKQR